MFKFFQWQLENQITDHTWKTDPDSACYRPCCNLKPALQPWFAYFKKNLKNMPCAPVNTDSIFPMILDQYTEIPEHTLREWFYGDDTLADLRDRAWVDNYIIEEGISRLLLQQSKIHEKLQLDQAHTRLTLHCQRPGQLWPMHIDRKKNNEFNSNDYTRYLIFFDDWQPGQILQMGTEFIKWQAGDVFGYFDQSVPHGSANFSHHDRLMLMVTGIKNTA
jgi:hypothetical protein